MKYKSAFSDPSTGAGVFRGDLAYGRCKGNIPVKHKDFVAAVDENGKELNEPVVPLVLVAPRDPEVWRRDPKLKERKKGDDGFQPAVNYLINRYVNAVDRLRANIHITVGKHRM